MNLSCTFFQNNQCRSCSILNLDYDQQLKLKEAQLPNEIRNILPTIQSPLIGFRDKVKLAIGGTLENPNLGLVLEDLTVQDLTGCPVQSSWINHKISKLKNFIQIAKLTPFNIEENSGELKYIIIFHSPTTDEAYVRIVLRSKESLDRIKKNLNLLSAFKVISANIQPERAALLEGKDEYFFTEQEYIKHQFNQHPIYLHSKSFVQTNTEVASKLYKTAGEWISTLHGKKIIDLFCGAGAFSFHVYSAEKTVIGIEINPEAIEWAQKTANDFKLNLQFQTMDLLKTHSIPYAEIVIVNPPRRGLGQSLELIQKLKPQHLLYSSCDIVSLKKDLNILRNDYLIEKAQIFDMFPHTHHFETLTLLSLR